MKEETLDLPSPEESQAIGEEFDLPSPEESLALGKADTQAGAVQTARESLADSAMLGLIPQAQAAAQPMIEGALEMITGKELLPEQKEKTFKERVQFFEERLAAMQEGSPKAALLGSLAGYAIPGAGLAKSLKGVSKAAGATTKTGKALKYIAEGAVGEGSLAKRATGIGTVGFAEGLAYDPPGATETWGEEAKARLEQAALSGAFSAGATPVISGAGKVIKKATTPLRKMGPKALNVLFFKGRVEDQIIKYLKDPDLINDAKSYDELYEIVQEVVLPVRLEAREAKISYDDAKKSVDEIMRWFQTEFTLKRQDLTEAFKTAKKELDADFALYYDSLKAVKPPIELEDEVVLSLQALKQQAHDKRDEALNFAVEEIKEPIDISDAMGVILDAKSAYMKPDGSVVKFPTAEKSIKQLEVLEEAFNDFGMMVDPRGAKQVITFLDELIDYSKTDLTAAHTERVQLAFSNARKVINNQLKAKSPGYKASMKESAQLFDLLSKSRDKFGKSDQRLNFFNSLAAPSKRNDRALLLTLGEKTGKDFAVPVEEYLAVQNEIKKLRTDRAYRQELLEEREGYLPFVEAEAELNAHRRIVGEVKKRQIKEQVAATADAKRLQANTDRLDNANRALEEITFFTGKNTAQRLDALIRALNTGRNAEAAAMRENFEKMIALPSQDFAQQAFFLREVPEQVDISRAIEAAQIKMIFDRDFAAGSRNVNLFAGLGMAADDLLMRGLARQGSGAVAGSAVGGPWGVVAGLIMGASVDRYGPAMAKRMLDGVISIKGIPTKYKIMNLDLPPDVKADLLKQFNDFVQDGGGFAGQEIKVSPEDVVILRDDIRRDPNMSPSDKAKILNELNKHGAIKSPELIWGDPKAERDKEDKTPVQDYVDSLS